MLLFDFSLVFRVGFAVAGGVLMVKEVLICSR